MRVCATYLQLFNAVGWLAGMAHGMSKPCSTSLQSFLRTTFSDPNVNFLDHKKYPIKQSYQWQKLYVYVDVRVMMLLALESWYKGNNSPSLKSSVVDEEWMRPSHWLGLSVLPGFIL